MNTTVESLQALYVKLGGSIEDVADKTTIPEMLDAITLISGTDKPEIDGISINGGAVVTPDENGIIDLTIGDGSTAIDPELSLTSTNPVQNKIVTGEINSLNESVTALNGSLDTLKADLGDLENLDTTDKSNLVAAINEVAQTGGADAVSLLKEQIYNSYPNVEAETGFIVSISDGADGIPVKSLVVGIDPVQAGSGDPSPTNVRPISGWTGASVKRLGVNLWDEEWEKGTLDTSTGEKVTSNVTMLCKNFIPIKPGMKCTAVGPYNVITTNSFIICYYDKNGTYVDYRTLTRPGPFEVPSDGRIALMRFAYRYYLSDSGGVYNHDVSVNCPSTYTAYAPYQVETYSITFPSEAGTVYGGTLDVTNGVLTVDMAIVDMGTLNWMYYSDQQRIVAQINSAKIAGGNFGLDGACSVYKVVNTPYRLAPDKSIVIGNNFVSNSYAAMVVHDEDYTDAKTFKTAVSGHTLVYPIKTPVTYQLTPTEVTTLLGTNNIWSDTGDSTVEYRADTKLYVNGVYVDYRTMLAPVESTYIATRNYTTGQLLIVGNTLYKVTANIANNGTITPNSNVVATTLSEVIASLS